MKLEARNLSCVRGNKKLFRNLSFSLSEGELLWVQGQNGAGKSSFLKILTGLLTPEKGGIFWQDKAVLTQETDYKQAFGFLGHQHGLKRNLTIEENISYHLALTGKPIKKVNEKQPNLLSRFQLSDVRNFFPHQLSAGQQRKAALISLMLKEPTIWVLDEPFTALDMNSQMLLNTLMREHLFAGGMIVMASHINLDGDHRQKIIQIPC